MIEYRDTADGLTVDQLIGFFVDWTTKPTPAVHLDILHGSSHVIVAVDVEPDRAVGFVTAISDGVLSAYVPLLEVLPECQGKGIGSELMRRILKRLEHLYMVDLLCDAPLQAYYARFGMRPATGVLIRRQERVPTTASDS